MLPENERNDIDIKASIMSSIKEFDMGQQVDLDKFYEIYKQENVARGKRAGNLGFSMFRNCKCPCIKWSQWHGTTALMCEREIAVQQCLLTFANVATEIRTSAGGKDVHERNCQYCKDNPDFFISNVFHVQKIWIILTILTISLVYIFTTS